MTSKREPYIRRLEGLRTERQSWVPHWRELSEFIQPRRGRFLLSDRNKGGKRNGSIINSTGRDALRTLRSGLMSGITNPARPWFRLRTPDPEMMEFGQVKAWLAQVEKILYAVFADSNIYNVMPVAYTELGLFGTAPIMQMDDFESVVRFYPFTAGEYFLAQNEKLQIDTLYREYSMTIAQVVAEFDLENCSANVQNRYQAGGYDEWVDIIHVVEPRTERETGKLDAKNKAWASIYFEKDCSEDTLLRESGFDRFPIYAPRWETTGTDVYGMSPGMDALGDIKQLQTEEKQKGQGIEKMINPPMTGPSSLKGRPATVLPGKVTYIDVQQGQQGFQPAYQVNLPLQYLIQDIEAVQQRINRAFYADLFAMLITSDRRDMTATEVAAREEEKLIMLGPVLSRINEDLLDPLIDNVFIRAAEAGILPPPPQEIQGTELGVEYISLLHQAQQLVGVGSIERTAGMVGNLVTMFPEVRHKFDAMQAVDEYATALGTPARVIRSNEEATERVAAEQQQAQQAEQAQQMLGMANQGAQAAKMLSETDVDTDSALKALMSSMGAA